jgi:hypothetical protein
VLFPEPDGPTIATNSPFETENDTFLRASTFVSPAPYVLHKFSVINTFKQSTPCFFDKYSSPFLLSGEWRLTVLKALERIN